VRYPELQLDASVCDDYMLQPVQRNIGGRLSPIKYRWKNTKCRLHKNSPFQRLINQDVQAQGLKMHAPAEPDSTFASRFKPSEAIGDGSILVIRCSSDENGSLFKQSHVRGSVSTGSLSK